MRLGLGHMAVVAALALTAVPAAAQQPGGWTAPAYPGNTMTLSHDDTLVAGTVARVKVGGHAEWKGPTDELTTPYDLYLFVQDPDVVPSCARSYGAQLQAGINVDLNASTAISGWVMEGDLQVAPTPPATGVDWSGDSVPFSVKPGLDRVLLCGYQRYITDDVAGFELPLRVTQPRCRAVRGSVTRGRALRIECNVSGRVRIRLRGPVTRTVSARLSAKDGTTKVSTRALRPGAYRVSITGRSGPIGRTFRIRVR